MSTMNHTTPPNRAGRSRTSFWSLVALAILFVGLTGYLTLTRVAGFGARQVAAAPAPAQATPVPTTPEGTTGPRRIQGRVLDAGTGQPLRGVSLWSGRRELLTDDEGRFALDLAAGQSPAVIVKKPGYERKSLNLTEADATVKLRPQTVKAAYLTYYGIADKRIQIGRAHV